jgi:hypothetical protein
VDDLDLAAARQCVRTEPVVETVASAADGVAAAWEGPATTDRSAAVDALARELGPHERALVALLDPAVTAAGRRLRATPVPAPPYYAVTARGPLLRGPVADGRLLVGLDVFAVERGEQTRYRRREDSPAESVRVEFRRAPDRR